MVELRSQQRHAKRSLISPHPEYSALGSNAEQRHTAYRALFDQRLEPALQRAIREATNGGYPLASEAFKTVVLAPLGYRTEPGKVGRPARSPEGDYAAGKEIGL